jgi:menaquinone-specific isochorismate synthase
MTAIEGQPRAATQPGVLGARTVALREPPDLLAFAGDDGLLWRDDNGGLAGQGVALRLDLPGGLADDNAVRGIGQALQAIVCHDDVGLPGCGPVAMGALPFDPAAAGSLVVPSRLVGRLGNRAWLTVIGPEATIGPDAPTGNGGTDEDSLPVAEAADGREPPDGFTLTPSLPHQAWKDLVAAAVERINAHELDKVVLARRVDITANRPFVISDVLGRLMALYPSCMVFSVEGFLGASPELLISRTGDRVASHPLAGTVARSGDLRSDEALVAGLLSSAKDRGEHQVVIDALRRALAPVCAELVVPDTPEVMSLRNVSHLATRITGRLAATTPETAFELVARVHPTPAVGGDPTDTAVRYLQQVEGFDRGRYAGPVGWVDARGDGAWAIGIRCAEVDGAHARLFAGNGMVTGSDPAEELTETQLKLQALLAALVRP